MFLIQPLATTTCLMQKNGLTNKVVTRNCQERFSKVNILYKLMYSTIVLTTECSVATVKNSYSYFPNSPECSYEGKYNQNIHNSSTCSHASEENRSRNRSKKCKCKRALRSLRLRLGQVEL